ncbi:hypothetical protein H6P81_010336 [Aristolochia fimbriata]|uniref:DUF6821 domain-containing protein n=1 Tax=Aristolochia fimbriata TaxID=158543 RepID=A0AAV7ERD2_ARIFI|nr:hypothetical protein H6P81_010336 [Aristolochia fimbriata]
MEKASVEMDWEEWEILPRDGLLEFPKQPVFNPNGIFETNYFSYDSGLKSPDKASDSGDVKLQTRLGSAGGKDPADGDLMIKDIPEVPAMEISRIPPVILEKMKPTFTGEQDSFSQVFFKKMKETEFDDMKIGSPRSATKGLKPHLDMGTIQFEDKEEVTSDGNFEYDTSKIDDLGQGVDQVRSDNEQECSSGGNGFTIWKWRVTGIGALCSIGVAAATICIFIIGSCHKHKQQHQNQKLTFQIYSDDKRIKHVVNHATKLNQALRGAPLARANITFGGYYDGI